MTLDLEERARLEAERDFLLRSLDDLDDELRVGNIDPDQYRVLHDDYTARAAAVIKTLDDGVERAAPGAPRATRTMRIVTACGLVVFAVLAGILLAHAVGQRHPGQTITGNSQVNQSATDALASARSTAVAQPKSFDAQMAYAQALLDAGRPADAVVQYGIASKVDPKRPEPHASIGWLSALIARQVTDPSTRTQLFASAEREVDRAITLDPKYVPAYAYKGIMLSAFEGKSCAGVPALQQYLLLTPEADPMRDQVGSALSTAVKAGKCPTGNTPTTTLGNAKP